MGVFNYAQFIGDNFKVQSHTRFMQKTHVKETILCSIDSFMQTTNTTISTHFHTSSLDVKGRSSLKLAVDAEK